MSDKEERLNVGEDGRAYYKYRQGQVFELSPKVGAAFNVKIIACEYTNDEYYRIESAGKELSTRFSINQLEAMLARLPCKELEAGEAVELPLLNEEVQEFYAAKRKELNKANVEANAKLKGTAFHKNLTTLKTVSGSIRLAKAQGEPSAELEKKFAELKAEQAKILAEKGVDERILRKVAACSFCNDTGILEGSPCICALAQAEAIKAYNAELRKAVVGVQ